MTTQTTTIIHTVYNERTLCGKHAPIKTTCTREKISALNSPWVSCPICTLAATCATLDTTRTAPKPNHYTIGVHPSGARNRWAQPTLFN